MRKAQWGLAALIVTLAVTAEAQVPAPKKLPDLKTSVATSANLKPATVEKVFTALGPAVREHLAAGKTVEVPGVGTFRVVRVKRLPRPGSGHAGHHPGPQLRRVRARLRIEYCCQFPRRRPGPHRGGLHLPGQPQRGARPQDRGAEGASWSNALKPSRASGAA